MHRDFADYEAEPEGAQQTYEGFTTDIPRNSGRSWNFRGERTQDWRLGTTQYIASYLVTTHRPAWFSTVSVN
jgi:hypothetical protein